MYVSDVNILSRSDGDVGPRFNVLSRGRSTRAVAQLGDDLGDDSLEGISLKGIAKAVKKVAAPVQKAVAKGAKAVGKVATSKVGKAVTGVVLAATGVGLPAAAAIGAGVQAAGAAAQGKRLKTIAKEAGKGAAIGAAGSLAGKGARKAISLVKREKVPPAAPSKFDELTAANKLPEISQLPSTSSTPALKPIDTTAKAERARREKLKKPAAPIAPKAPAAPRAPVRQATPKPSTPTLLETIKTTTIDVAPVLKAATPKARELVRDAKKRKAAAAAAAADIPAPAAEQSSGGSGGGGGGGSSAPIDVAPIAPANVVQDESGDATSFVKKNAFALGASVIALGVLATMGGSGRRSS